MSGYDIKKLVDAGLSHFWSENYGQIYPTLDGLVKDGLATKSSERHVGKRPRNIYTITAKGKAEFKSWLQGSTAAPVTRNELQLKFFLSAYKTRQALELVAAYREQQQMQLEEYTASESLLKAALDEGTKSPELEAILKISSPNSSQKRKQLEVFLLTLRHGILAVQARIAWCDEVKEYLNK